MLYMTIYIYIYIYILSYIYNIYIYTYIVIYRKIVQCVQTCEMLQVGIKTWVTLRQQEIIPQCYKQTKHKRRDFNVYVSGLFCLHIRLSAAESSIHLQSLALHELRPVIPLRECSAPADVEYIYCHPQIVYIYIYIYVHLCVCVCVCNILTAISI